MFKTLFTILAAPRYARAMLWLFAAAMTATLEPQAPPSSPAVTAQARAVIRVISGVRLKLDAEHNLDAPSARQTVLAANGSVQPARLIEFQ